MKAKLAIFLSMCLASTFAYAQVTSDFTLTVNPMVDIPLGPNLTDGTSFYTIGGGISLKGEYSLPFAQFIYTGLVFDANFAPINASENILTLLSLGPEIGLQVFPITRLGLRIAGIGGWYAGMVTEGTAINGFAGGALDISWLVNPSLTLGVGATYKRYFTPTEAIYEGIGINLGVRYHIGAEGTRASIWVEPAVRPIFPLFYGYYDKNAAGTIMVRNTSPGPVQDVTVSFYVKQYMDAPKICWQYSQLSRDEEKDIPLFALFSNSIFGVTEQTRVAGVVEISFKYLGTESKSSYPVTVTINNRNGMVWDDTNKTAAFVTSNDPSIRSLIARVVPDARSKGKPAINSAFRSAIALFEAMRIYGVRYVPDPKAFASKVVNTEDVDYLQFASQTLELKAGDCDDLSILYSTLLESAGIETAFITVPGHIYIAFDTGLDQAGARSTFSKPEDLIIQDGRAWLPVEITRVKDGFLKAWQTGAQEWRAGSASSVAALYPVHKAWETYSPANVGDMLKAKVGTVDSTKVYNAFAAELEKFFDADFQPRISRLQADLKKKADPALQNKLGVLYARFGMYGEASQQFSAVVKQNGDVPSALINLGNIAYLSAKYKDAAAYYARALAKAPMSSAALQGAVLSAYELGDAASVQGALAKLKEADPAAAERLAALDASSGTTDSTRRAAAFEKEVSSWDE
jgi:transglutaminase-like putative cysteine protease